MLTRTWIGWCTLYVCSLLGSNSKCTAGDKRQLEFRCQYLVVIR